MFRSPSIARLADTPPVVGSVMTETYGKWACARRDKIGSMLRLLLKQQPASAAAVTADAA